MGEGHIDRSFRFRIEVENRLGIPADVGDRQRVRIARHGIETELQTGAVHSEGFVEIFGDVVNSGGEHVGFRFFVNRRFGSTDVFVPCEVVVVEDKRLFAGFSGNHGVGIGAFRPVGEGADELALVVVNVQFAVLADENIVIAGKQDGCEFLAGADSRAVFADDGERGRCGIFNQNNRSFRRNFGEIVPDIRRGDLFKIRIVYGKVASGNSRRYQIQQNVSGILRRDVSFKGMKEFAGGKMIDIAHIIVRIFDAGIAVSR